MKRKEFSAVKIRKDLDLSKPNTLDELYNIHFKFTDGKYQSRNLESICTWDTESSNGFLLPDGSNKVIEFNQKKYDRGILKTHDVSKDKIDYEDEDVKYMMLIDECTPVGIISGFSFSIEDGTGGIYTYIGRDWDDYLNFQLKLTQEIKRQSIYGFESIDREYENMKIEKMKTNVNMRIYTHNLGHDWQFLRSLYNEEFVNAKHTRIFARKNRKPMKASMRLNGMSITYLDTVSLFNKSLKDLAHDCPNCPIEKLDDYDYLTIKTPKDKLEPQEIAYMIHDTAILVYAIEYEREQFKTLGNIPLTQTGKVRRVLETNVCARNPYWAYNCAYITRSTSPEEYRKKIALYQGGYTHGCAAHIGEVNTVHMYDFASSYPSSLCTSYFPTEGYEPCDVSEFDELAKQDVERPKYRWFAKIRLTNVRPLLTHSYWSESKCVELENPLTDNGRIRRAGIMTIWASDLDWATFTHAYVWDSMEVLDLEKGKASLLPREMIETILDYYGKKTLLKGNKERESEYITSKEICNCIYGNFTYKLVSDQVYFDGNWETRRLDDEGDPMFYELITQVSDTKANGFFDLGIICSSVSRFRLWQFIIKFDEKCLYMDTDSVKGTFDEDDRKWIEEYNKHIEELENDVAKQIQIDPERFCPKTADGTPKRLGIMEYEGEAKLKYLGAKRYITEENGKIKCTIAGLPKSAGTDKIKSFDDFNNHTLWTTEESHKVCCYYNDNQPERMEWTGRDGEVYFSSDKYGVCLKPVTFDLSMSDEFVSFLNALFSGTIDTNDITEQLTPKYLLG